MNIIMDKMNDHNSYDPKAVSNMVAKAQKKWFREQGGNMNGASAHILIY
jgi:hypothetical protein